MGVLPTNVGWVSRRVPLLVLPVIEGVRDTPLGELNLVLVASLLGSELSKRKSSCSVYTGSTRIHIQVRVDLEDQRDQLVGDGVVLTQDRETLCALRDSH